MIIAWALDLHIPFESMEKLRLIIITIILCAQATAFAKAKVQKAVDRSVLAPLISTFDLTTQSDGSLKIELQNVNGQKKSAELKKIEEYTEFTRYALDNPFSAAVAPHVLNLYVFSKIKPTMVESKDSTSAEEDLADLKLDLVVLLDSVSKKTLKTKGVFFYREHVVAEGSVDNNSQIKITDDLSGKVKNCKLQELKVTKNLLGSDKRSLDLEVRLAQSGKQIRQKLNVNLLNMKLTPIKKVDEIEEYDEELDFEGEENETDSTRS